MRYFDHNATTPVSPEILEQLTELFAVYGNASSIHSVGRRAMDALEEARSRVLSIQGLSGYKLVFTSGGTESNRLALNHLAEQGPAHGRRVVLFSAIEHPCIRNQKPLLERAGFSVQSVPVTSTGIVDVDQFVSLADDMVACVCVMLANNETGAIQPVREIAQLCADRGIHFHCDAVQGPGKTQIDWANVGADSITLTAHKFYGLKGTGILLYKDRPRPIFFGGAQEKGIRPGTENVPGAMAFALAFENIEASSPTLVPHLKELQKMLEDSIVAAIPGTVVYAAAAPRLANTSCLTIPGLPNDLALVELDRRGFCISTGAACHSGIWEPSHVLLAMGVDHEAGRSAVRISTGRATTPADVDALVSALKEVHATQATTMVF